MRITTILALLIFSQISWANDTDGTCIGDEAKTRSVLAELQKTHNCSTGISNETCADFLGITKPGAAIAGATAAGVARGMKTPKATIPLREMAKMRPEVSKPLFNDYIDQTTKQFGKEATAMEAALKEGGVTSQKRAYAAVEFGRKAAQRSDVMTAVSSAFSTTPDTKGKVLAAMNRLSQIGIELAKHGQKDTAKLITEAEQITKSLPDTFFKSSGIQKHMSGHMKDVEKEVQSLIAGIEARKDQIKSYASIRDNINRTPKFDLAGTVTDLRKLQGSPHVFAKELESIVEDAAHKIKKTTGVVKIVAGSIPKIGLLSSGLLFFAGAANASQSTDNDSPTEMFFQGVTGIGRTACAIRSSEFVELSEQCQGIPQTDPRMMTALNIRPEDTIAELKKDPEHFCKAVQTLWNAKTIKSSDVKARCTGGTYQVKFQPTAYGGKYKNLVLDVDQKNSNLYRVSGYPGDVCYFLELNADGEPSKTRRTSGAQACDFANAKKMTSIDNADPGGMNVYKQATRTVTEVKNCCAGNADPSICNPYGIQVEVKTPVPDPDSSSVNM